MPFRQSFPYPCVRLQIWHNPFYVWANEGVDIQNYNIGLLYTEYTFSNFPCSDSSSLGETQCSFPRNGKVYSVCGSERHKIDYRVLICWAVLPRVGGSGYEYLSSDVRMMACTMFVNDWFMWLQKLAGSKYCSSWCNESHRSIQRDCWMESMELDKNGSNTPLRLW